MKHNSFERLVEIISAKIDGNLATYLPRVQTFQMDFEDYRMQNDDEVNNIKKFTTELRQLSRQLEELKRAPATPANESAEKGAVIDRKQYMEMLRKVQEHDRELKRMKENSG